MALTTKLCKGSHKVSDPKPFIPRFMNHSTDKIEDCIFDTNYECDEFRINMIASYYDRGTILTGQIMKIDDAAYYLNRVKDSPEIERQINQLIKVPRHLIKPASEEDVNMFFCMPEYKGDGPAVKVPSRPAKYATDRLQKGDLVPYIRKGRIFIGKIDRINPKTYEIDYINVPHMDIILDDDAFKRVSPRLCY